MEIFDFHLHPYYDFHENDTDPHRFVDTLKKQGVTGSAGCGINMACQNHPTDEYDRVITGINEKTWAFHSLFPDFFVPGIHIHPDHVDHSVKEMQKHKEKGGILVGELVYYMMGWRYLHKNTLSLMETARDMDMVVSVHPSKDFEYVEAIADNIKGIKLVVAHLDAYGLYERQLALIKKHENVYADLSAYGAEREGMIADAVNRVGSEKILYGSDFPGYSVSKFINAVEKADVSTADKENILYRNAKRLLFV